MAHGEGRDRTVELAWKYLPGRDENQRLTSRELIEKIRSADEDLGVAEATFAVYLSQAAGDADNTGICRDLGVQGYFTEGADWVSPRDDAGNQGEEPTELDDSSGDGDEQKRGYRQIERLLYPHLVNYLTGHGYRAMDVSSSLKLGRWGCPDVLGVRSDKVFSGREHETVSIEAKQTDGEFEKDIFEAVAHRRFVNRSYFAFAANSSYLTSQHDKLRYYAELYKVGVLVLVMVSDEQLSQFRNGTLEELGPDDVTVVELVSAPFEEKRPRWQAELFAQLGWQDDSDIASWGLTV